MYTSNSSGVYAIVDNGSGNRYVGSAVSIKKRFNIHLWHLMRGTHHSAYLQRVWNKRGKGAFSFVVLELCGEKKLIKREQHFIDERAEFNICRVAYSKLGVKHTQKAKDKLSLSHKTSPKAAAHRARLADARRGHPQSAAHRAKVVAGLAASTKVAHSHDKTRGVPLNADRRVKSIQAGLRRRGIPHTPEHNKKLSVAAFARWARVREAS